MAAEERWYFTKEKLLNTPSRKCGVDPDKELSYRQQAANFIQDMGQRLQVNQLCINTAIVYVHRFYMFHSFTRFHRNAISTCALFLAAKVEEQPRKLEHVIKVAHMCLHREAPPLDSKSEAYLEQSQELISNENIMLQTLGFDVAIDHPHTHVVKCCQLVRGHHHHATASKELAQTSYFMATNSLHLTTMCLQYKPTVVACVCIHLACKWAELQIPMSSEGKDWYWYVDKTVTFDLLEELTAEFLVIFDRCPSRLKRKMMSSTGMNDKIQDVAMVEKKLTAEFAAHASGNRAAAAAASSSGSSRSSSDKSDRHRSHNASWPSSMTAKVLGHDDRNSDAEQNGGTPVTPEVRRERTSSSKRDAVNCATSKSAVINCANTSAASMSKSSGSSTLSSSSPLPPQTMVSPIRPSSRQMSSTDLGYSSMTSSNSQPSQEHMVVKQEPASPPPPPSSSTVELTPKKIKSEFGSGRGMTPKEYRERKKRERAVELAVEEKAHLLETPKEPKPQTPSSQSRKRTSSSSSESSGSMLSLARHMQPIVALTSLNLTELTNKIPSSKHVLISAKHSRHLTTPEKQPRSSSSSTTTTTPVTGDGDHNNGRHKRVLVVDDAATTTIAIQRVNRGDDPLPALVRPPILTPSPPLATGEESKPDILEERPMTLSFPSEDMVLGIDSPPSQPLQHLPQTSQTTTSAFDPNIQVKVEKDDTRARSTYPVHPSSSAVGLQPAASSAKRSDVKQTIKDRLIKHRKSRTQPKEPVVPAPPPPTPPQTPTETLSVPQAASTGFSPGVVAYAKPSDFRTVSPLNVTTITPITRFTGSHPLAATTDENGAATAASSSSSSSVTTQEQQRYPPLNLNTNSAPQTTTAELVQMVERKKQTNTKPPGLSAQAPAVVLTSVNSASEVLLSFGNRTSEKIPHQFVPIPTPTPSASSSSSVKHERKERHKHKDREKTRTSRGDKAGKGSISSAAPLVVAVQPPEQSTVQTPAIKLTIPKDRLNMTVVDAGKVPAGGARGVAAQVTNDNIGGLKIRIPKRKISASKASKTVGEPTPTKIAPPPPSAAAAVASALAAPMQLAPVMATAVAAMTTSSVASSAIVPPKEPAIGGGLKIKITKDRLGSMGTYSVGSREDNYRDKRTSEKESRKRERPPSPPLPYPSHFQPPVLQQQQQQQQQSRPLMDAMPQKTTLLPHPTGIAQAAAAPPPPSMAPMITTSSGSVSPKPAKMAKLASRSGRKSQSPQATLVMSPYDVPPSSNTRSSSKQDQPQRSDNYKPPPGRGHRGSGKHRGRGGGGGHGHQPPLQHPHPRFDASHQVTMNAGPYPYTPYYQYPPNFFSHPPLGPPPRHPHGPPPPMHPGDYPPPPPPFFGQPPPFRGPLPMAGGPAYQGPRQDSRVMPPLQIRRQFPPPLPSEPPPAIPPPPPPE